MSCETNTNDLKIAQFRVNQAETAEYPAFGDYLLPCRKPSRVHLTKTACPVQRNVTPLKILRGMVSYPLFGLCLVLRWDKQMAFQT